MQTIRLAYPLTKQFIEQNSRPQVLAIGQFDGLHLGHASVIQSAVRLASEIGLPASVMTFHPHPKEVMKKGDYDGYLTPPGEKERILREMGVEYVYIVEFDDAFSQVSPKDFVTGILVPLQVHTAVAGFDFHYGYRGEGNVDMLRELSGNALDVHTVPPFLIDGEKVSSSEIRKALQEGQIEQANRWFGRSYSLRGTVMHGEKRGRQLGFPTANLKLSEHYVVPASGVYAVRATHGQDSYGGVMNVGVKPTFHEDGKVFWLEAHLFDFSGDLYDQVLSVELVSYIRPERKFNSLDELIAQIGHDADTAKQLLSVLP